MFKIELSFDTERLGQDALERCFWAAIFALKESSDLVENLKKCFWYNGSAKENLITGFLRH